MKWVSTESRLPHCHGNYVVRFDDDSHGFVGYFANGKFYLAESLYHNALKNGEEPPECSPVAYWLECGYIGTADTIEKEEPKPQPTLAEKFANEYLSGVVPLCQFAERFFKEHNLEPRS